MHIVILDGYALNPGDLSWETLLKYGTVDAYDRTSPEQVIPRAQNADIIITNKVPFDAKTLDMLPALKCIVVTATGYNIIDTKATAERGIVVCNAPAYSTDSVAQHVFALLLHITTHVADYSTSNTNGKWTDSQDFCYIDHPTIELSGKTIGIVGLGNIGSKVAAIAHTFGMNVIALTSKQANELPAYIKPVSKSELFELSDIISMHCPLTEKTKNFINAETLSQIKQGAIIINTSRGPLVDEQALCQSLHSGHIAAFGADVLSIEPPTASNPLLSAPNSFTTPHIAWATKEARMRLMDITVKNVAAFADGAPINTVE